MSRRLDRNHSNSIIVVEGLFEFVLTQEVLELCETDKSIFIKFNFLGLVLPIVVDRISVIVPGFDKCFESMDELLGTVVSILVDGQSVT